jgi:outer membrane protein assembly factor BamB
MNRIFLLLLSLGVICLCGADWHQFRGLSGSSVSTDALPPDNLSETETVAWKAELPGRGPSGPIVVKNRVYLTAASGPKQDRLFVLCFDAESGQEVWRREFWATGRTYCHPTSGVAAPTPASDGQRIFAFFSSNDLACLDLDGNLLWYRGLAFDYPKAGNDVGMAASPAVTGDTVVVQIENQGDSFAAGLDVETGETRWRVARDPVANWASPVALPEPVDGKHLVLLPGQKALTALDAVSGQELWKYEMGCSSIPSPAIAAGRIFVPGSGLTVLEIAKGATTPSLLWQSNKVSPNQASPIVSDKRVLALNSAGVVTCAEAATGKILWQLRVGGTHWSTPVLAGDLLYCFNQEGDARVIRVSDEKGELLSSMKLGEIIQGSPAVVAGAIYVRSDKHLWKIAKKT